MQVTVNIPESLAVLAQSQGIPLETYVEQLLSERISGHELSARRIDLESFFVEISAGSENLPLPSEQAFSRESFYSDHD